MKIALAGNPNSGKTTIYNILTGKDEKVGNWAGVTVDKKEGMLKKQFSGGESVTVVDLPGAYSMSPFTKEESITSDFVKNEQPDVIINIVDSVNLSRSLFFTTQLTELGIPVVVALNKSDLADKKNITINIEKLSEKINCTIVETFSTGATENGFEELFKTAKSVVGSGQVAAFEHKDIDLSDMSAVHKEDVARFDFAKMVVSEVETRAVSSHERTLQDSIDKVLAHRILGLPIFAAIMWVVFFISQAWLGPIIAGWLEILIGMIYDGVAGALGDSASPILTTLLLDGIIGGVGAVLGFLPLIMVMFFLLALLEDCGYMARVAVIMDGYFKKVGLSGRSIIPMVIGTGCAIPGVMATRTIKDENQRRATAMLTPFIPCGAKLPVIALFAGAFFSDISAWMNTIMYFGGILVIILGAAIIRKITKNTAKRSFFIIELPEYKAPSIFKALLSMLSRGKAFIVKASTIILLCNVAVQIMQEYDFSFTPIGDGDPGTSILATLAGPFAFLLIPLGFGVWQLAAAAITGFIAKENVVGTLAVVYGIQSYIDTDALEMMEGSEAGIAGAMGLTAVAAMSYLVFNLFTPPCFAAIGAMNAEMESKKWLFGAIGLQLATGYTLAFLVYQIGSLLIYGSLGAGFIPGLIAVALFVAYLIYLMNKGSKKSPATLSAATK